MQGHGRRTFISSKSTTALWRWSPFLAARQRGCTEGCDCLPPPCLIHPLPPTSLEPLTPGATMHAEACAVGLVPCRFSQIESKCATDTPNTLPYGVDSVFKLGSINFNADLYDPSSKQGGGRV
jgi:hypothetical protein